MAEKHKGKEVVEGELQKAGRKAWTPENLQAEQTIKVGKIWPFKWISKQEHKMVPGNF